MKTFGGYLTLDKKNSKGSNQRCYKFNSGRSALEFIVKAIKPKTIYLPFYSCQAVIEKVKELVNNINYYHINDQLEPAFDLNTLSEEDTIIYTNYFGLKDKFIANLTGLKAFLIIDNAQSFYSTPHINMASFNSLRKFFGVPDGGFSYLPIALFDPRLIPKKKATSWQNSIHLFKAIDLGLENSYKDFLENEAFISKSQYSKISKVTIHIFGNIDLNKVAIIREKNFDTLKNQLNSFNHLKKVLLEEKMSTPLTYPFYHSNLPANAREILIEQKIFLPKYWPNLSTKIFLNESERLFCEKVLFLPIDQRLTQKDMKIIAKKVIKLCI